jgi:hypothetical protein
MFSVCRVQTSDIAEIAKRVGRPVDHLPVSPVGYACRDGEGNLVGVGFCAQAEDGRMWAIVHIEPILARHGRHLIHRHALMLVEWCRMNDVVLHVGRDPKPKRSRQWLSRLGFVQTTDFIQGQEVWKCPV